MIDKERDLITLEKCIVDDSMFHAPVTDNGGEFNVLDNDNHKMCLKVVLKTFKAGIIH